MSLRNDDIKKRQILRLFSLLWLGGAAWLALNAVVNIPIFICPFRYLTGILCPSCGMTSAILSLLRGDEKFFFINPFSVVCIAFLILFPLWRSFDLLTKKDSMFAAYLWAEGKIRKKRILIIIIILIGALNWAWTIYRYGSPIKINILKEWSDTETQTNARCPAYLFQ